MSTFVQISFSGLATGAIFALAAVGFALLWQTAGAINFAHGEFIVLPAVIILILGQQRPTLGVPDWVPLIGGTELAGPLPKIGIVAAFVVTIPDRDPAARLSVQGLARRSAADAGWR